MKKTKKSNRKARKSDRVLALELALATAIGQLRSDQLEIMFRYLQESNLMPTDNQRRLAYQALQAARDKLAHAQSHL